MGVTAGVPPRVEAGTKAALLDLVDGAVGEGWSTARACAVLELDGRRCRRWQHRRGAGRLEDSTAGGAASHAITAFERRAIVELFERWGDIDGGYRKLAHRGSYENLVWVSPSTLYRVLAAQGLVLPARPQRTPAPARPLPDWIEWRRHQIWIYDITHFPRAGRVAYAILDVVTRKWLATLVTAEETATQVEVVFTQALDTEGLWPAVEARQADRARRGDDSDEEPILLAMSDNGPQMRAGTTREFLAFCSIASRFGRPGTPTDQAWIETLFGHVKTEWPHLEKITDPNTLRTELDIARHDYNTRRLHASLGYVTPDDEHQGRADSHPPGPPRRPQPGPPHPHRLPSQQQTQPAMNTPAQCGVIKPPKTDIYSEAPQMASSWARSSWRICPKVNDRTKVPKVDGADTTNGSTRAAEPARSLFASSMKDPPASIDATNDNTFAPDPRPASGGRTTSSMSASSPRRSISVPANNSPASATKDPSSKPASNPSIPPDMLPTGSASSRG